jgi:DNA-directed RNA polymerase subunit RPC12/RpoP
MTSQKINLWEEKNLTEASMKYVNNGASEECDITKNIPTELKKENLTDITRKSWIKNCTKCNKEIVYFDKWQYKDSVKKNRNCKSCRSRMLMTGRRLSEVAKLKISQKNKGKKPWLGKKLSIKHRKKLSEYRKNNPTKLTEEQRIQRSNRFLGNKYRNGHLHKEDTKKRISDSMKVRVKDKNFLDIVKNKFIPNYNKIACSYFDNLNESNHWNLQHALNGGEIKFEGYWLDAYDKEKNIAVEYDECRHYYKNGLLKEKDLDRMNYIKNKLGCKFFRYNETKNELKEF